MEKTREKVFRRKESTTKMNNEGNKFTNNSSVGRDRIVRPRSRTVYTAKSYLNDDVVSSRDLSKYEGPGHFWHCPLPKPITIKNFHPDNFNTEMWADEGSMGGTTVSPHGVISLNLHNRIRVDVSLQRAVRIVNIKSGIILALNASGSSSALVHPNGRVYQYGSRVEIMARDIQGNNKYAKMWYKGVSFTSDHCALVYLVDAAGTRTTTDTFSDLTSDFTLGVFYNNCTPVDFPYNTDMAEIPPHGSQFVDEAISVLQAANYWKNEDRTDNWIINSIRISQTADGMVRVGRNSTKYALRTSPSNGSASISSPYIHCTGSTGQTRHLFVRRGERRMHYDGRNFIVRNAGHSAGFDEKHQLKVY